MLYSSYRGTQGQVGEGTLSTKYTAIDQKTRGFCSCPKVPASGVVMVIGWQQEGGLKQL